MKSLLTTCLLAMSVTSILADDWPQWRGPDRNEVSQESGLLKTWPKGGPPRVWLFQNAGVGYAGFAVVGDTLYTMGGRNGNEELIAVRVADGQEKWSAVLGPMLSNGWGDGPRGTPTVDGDRVYALSGQGHLACVQVADGKVVWRTTMQDFGGKTPNWGYTESVLIDGDRLLCTPGGSQGAMLALDKKTGKPIWQSGDFTERAQYSSIIAAENNGVRQYIQLTMSKLAGIDARTGKTLWTSDWPGKTAVIPTPIYHDSQVYATSGYGVGCKLIKLDADQQPTEVYFNRVMKNHHGGVVLLDGFVYGYSDGLGWICQNFRTGDLVWNEKNQLEKGCLTCADGKLYLLGEQSGEVVLIDASPSGWKEHGRFTLAPQTSQRKPKGKIWTHPVVANGKLYLRDQELLFCYDVRAR